MWDTQVCQHVIKLFAFPSGSIEGAVSLDLRRIPGLTRSLTTPDGRRHLLVKLNGRSMQICLSGTFSRTAHLLADAVVRQERLAADLQALDMFNHLLLKRDIPARYSRANKKRLGQVLFALDARRAGASYRDIAVGLAGIERVRHDWNNDGDHLKNQVRRLVKRGEYLVDGGYRRFLQQRF